MAFSRRLGAQWRGGSATPDLIGGSRGGGTFEVYPPPHHSHRSRREESSAPAAQSEQDSLAPPPPIRLFAKPEPIEATAEVPDGPPVQFTWRRMRHLVAHAEGPERIAMEWWRDDRGNKLTRDYFRIESDGGMRAWLYREGLYGRVGEGPPGEIRPPHPPQWFLHGLFA